MSGRPSSVRGSPRWPRRYGALLAAGLVFACGPGEPEGEEVGPEPFAEAAVAEEQAEDSAAALRRFLPDDMQRSTRPATFAHDAHVQIDCSVCHQVAQGHGSHEDVECADCHRASEMATVRSLTPQECLACHHGPEQTWTCERCHEAPGVHQTVQQLSFEVWTGSRSRTLAFDHGWHEVVECESCHREAPLLEPEACASCHEDHHVATIRCASCHTPAPESAHDVEAHLTCSGSGCHRAPDIEAIADTRAVCLACHQELEEHEPAGDCVECHRVRPGLERRTP
ncbi:MAG TPA: hypothetical protein VLA09_03555 [Longimicrobiales bacterium]|nr:hypothetical protein [Longimicrobiales bacterium]